MDESATAALRKKYAHPIWKAAGEVAKKVGGHGGMDFIMDLRWSYCLQNGIPLDTDVHDLAAWSSTNIWVKSWLFESQGATGESGKVR